ncbi:MAG: RNA polymerase sigma factor [Acidobacteriota bacterium]|nr:RNA polymerase sigma factor [Acidobacteriota bacterium]MDH3523067.1 RNA polymerase sigma factor [Acidobacteriota bacterium]
MDSILQRIAQGDPTAVATCIDTYGGLVWSIARRFTDNSGDAEDAVQDIFIAIWKNAAKFEPAIASEKTFITMIARRRLIDRLRKANRRPQLTPMPEEGQDPSGDQHVRIERGAEASLATRHLDVLSPAQRRAIELSVYYGMSHREIAEETNIPIGTVKSHIFRGLALVRKSLAAEMGGAGVAAT